MKTRNGTQSTEKVFYQSALVLFKKEVVKQSICGYTVSSVPVFLQGMRAKCLVAVGSQKTVLACFDPVFAQDGRVVFVSLPVIKSFFTSFAFPRFFEGPLDFDLDFVGLSLYFRLVRCFGMSLCISTSGEALLDLDLLLTLFFFLF